jgi:hypothetical protein
MYLYPFCGPDTQQLSRGKGRFFREGAKRAKDAKGKKRSGGHGMIVDSFAGASVGFEGKTRYAKENG